MIVVVIIGTVLVGGYVALALLTGLGASRRGAGRVAPLAGLFFPVTWAAWYVQDERPQRRS